MRNVYHHRYPLLCFMIDQCWNHFEAQQKGSAEALAQGLVGTVATGCEKELAAYCQGVTPGEGRILACLYAHADKLSGQCEYALFDAAAQLERAVAALAYLVPASAATTSTSTAQAYTAGEGRLLDCLDKNEKKTSSRRCKQALKDTGLK